MVTHPDHIAQAIKTAVERKIQECNDKYDKAIEAAQAMLLGTNILCKECYSLFNVDHDKTSQKKGKKPTTPAILDRAQVAALLQVKV